MIYWIMFSPVGMCEQFQLRSADKDKIDKQ